MTSSSGIGGNGGADEASTEKSHPLLPRGSCDIHLHFFGDARQFPFIADRSYTPAPATAEDYWAAYRPVGVERCIFVQPSVYGRDHELLKQSLRNSAPGTMRGVAVVFEDTTDVEIEALHRLGVRGTRCNALFQGGVSVAALRGIADRIRHLGWHIQLLVNVDHDPELVGRVASLGLPVVVDHFGHPSQPRDASSRGLKNLRSLLVEGRAWVKFSGAYRFSDTGSGIDPVATVIARDLAEANSSRILWGSDWPHPGVDAHSNSSAELAKAATDWLVPEVIEKVLVHNPTQLYWND